MTQDSASVSLPLYDLFEAVQDLDQQTDHFTVDLQSYFLLIETMMEGYMILSKENLFLLCEKLWLKPYHRNSDVLNRNILLQLFNEKFDAYSDALEKTVADSDENKKKKIRPPSERDKTKPALNLDPDGPPPSESDQAIMATEGELSLYIGNIKSETEQSGSASENTVTKFLKQNFFLKGNYLPVNARRLEQSIRSYRFPVKGGRKTGIDMEATIKRIAKTRFFDDFEYRAEETFKTDWTILIDHSDSMAAFFTFSEEIKRLASVYSVDKQKTNIYYFKNYPTTHLYTDSLQTTSISWEDFIADKKMNILVISDAGAARGYNYSERVKAVVNFLREMKQHRVAWLNPLPKERWKDTSAEMIAGFTDMFGPGEGDNDGLTNIVRLFKSKIRTAKF